MLGGGAGGLTGMEIKERLESKKDFYQEKM